MGNEILTRILVMTTIFLPMYLFAFYTKRREHFVLRTIISFAILVVVGVLAGVAFYYFYRIPSIAENIIWYETGFYLLLFVGFTALLCLPFDMGLWGLLFCSSAGYCVQHIGARLGSLLELALGYSMMTEPVIPELAVKFLTFFLNIGLSFAVFFFLNRRGGAIGKDTIEKIANPRQVLIASIVFFIMVGYNSFGTSYVTAPYYSDMDNLLFRNCFVYGTVFVCITSIVIAFLCLVVEFSWFIGGRLIHQKEMLEGMLEDQKKNLALEEEATKTLDVAVHDLRHLIGDFGNDIDSKRRARILNIIKTYDSIIKTGNKAIDVILTKKSLYCSEKSIRLTCCLDGKSFDFMEPHELYALFENALDNAIEAVEGLPLEKRSISVTEKRQGMFTSLRVENYCDKKITFQDGLPLSDKKDEHHGFGMMSMDMIARKYGGKLEAKKEGDLFSLEVFLIAKKAS